MYTYMYIDIYICMCIQLYNRRLLADRTVPCCQDSQILQMASTAAPKQYKNTQCFSALLQFWHWVRLMACLLLCVSYAGLLCFLQFCTHTHELSVGSHTHTPADHFALLHIGRGGRAGAGRSTQGVDRRSIPCICTSKYPV
jgi:hypothetical protein